MRFVEAQKQAKEKGWQLEKLPCNKAIAHRYRHYKTGFVVFDGEESHRWQKLGDFVLNCLEENRWIDGYLRTY